MSSSSPPPIPWKTLAAGLAAFALGLAAAWTILPEWRAGKLPERQAVTARFLEVAHDLGLEAAPGAPRLSLTTDEVDLREVYRVHGPAARDWIEANRHAFLLRVEHLSSWPDSPAGELQVSFSADLVPRAIEWTPTSWAGILPGNFASSERVRELERTLGSALAGSGSLGEPLVAQSNLSGNKRVYALLVAPEARPAAAAEREHLLVQSAENWVSVAYRAAGSPEEGREAVGRGLRRGYARGLGLAARFFVVAVIFLVLALRRRLGLVNAALLAAAVAVVHCAAASPQMTGALTTTTALGNVALRTVFVFLLWASAESWLRSTIAGFSTSLDALLFGHPGPRSGRALLGGWALGAAAAGAGLAVQALAALLPGVFPGPEGVSLPFFGMSGSPLGSGILNAGFVVLALAVCRTLLPPRRAPAAATVLAGLVTVLRVGHEPWPFALAASLVLAGIYVFAFQRFGLTGCLTASIVAGMLPAATFSALHLAWLPFTFAVSAAVTLAVPVLGLVGLRRKRQDEESHMVVPGFLRRLEEERRLRFEMELLARMQLGLLPEKPPEVEGYELAATSLVATEAGGDLYDFLHDGDGSVWIAAGDVSGHGFPCTVELAMTKAALASLVTVGRRPSEVLVEVDRVLRTSRPHRSFTSLCLLRLAPESGEIVVANAGYPFPLVAADGGVEEIALPGLPLGQGPDREYEDRTFVLARGSALVLFSDGLFEAPGDGGAYGVESPREILAEHRDGSAEEILAALLADWRRYAGHDAPVDDTTLVVLKRRPDSG